MATFIWLKENGNFYTNGYPSGPKATIIVTKEPYPANLLFERVSHKIKYNKEFPEGGSYFIYDGTIYNEGTKIFEYFNVKCILDRVDGYYSIQDPSNILLLGFKYRNWFHSGKTCYYTYNKYTRNKYISFDLISKASFSLPKGQGPGDKVKSNILVTENLTSENKIVNAKFKDKKVKLETTKGSKKENVKEINRTVGDFIFTSFIADANGTPSPGDCILSKDKLFKEGIHQNCNSIDERTLTSVKEQKFDLINVYYPKCTKGGLTLNHAILIELVNESTKTHFRRICLEGNKKWMEVGSLQISYNTIDELCKLLASIQIGLINPLKVCVENKRASYENSQATVRVNSEPFSSCIEFEKVTHVIECKCPNYCVYSVILCRSNETVRRYCSSKPLIGVEIYFWKYKTKEPLVAGFMEKDMATKYYKYKDLEKVGCIDLSPKISIPYILLKSLLFTANNETNKKIKFTTSTGSMNGVKKLHGYLGNFSITSFISNLNGELSSTSTLFKDNLFNSVLESNNSIDNETLTSVNDHQFNNINVYYPTNTDGNVTKDHAILVELVSDENKTHIRRISLKGQKQWDLVNTPLIYYDGNDELYVILKGIQYGLNSIIVLILDRQVAYCRDEIKGITELHTKDSQPESILVTPQRISHTTYRYYTHVIAPSTTTSLPQLSANVNKYLTIELVPYINNRMIALKDSKGLIDQRIYYKKGSNDKVYVYFYKHDNIPDTVPLLFYSNNRWYSPQSKDQYFKQWNEVQSLKGVPSGYTSYNSTIKDELDKINALLNEIDISKTSSYGIPWGCRKKSEFNSERINVQLEHIPTGYNIYKHSTTNKFQIKSIKHGKEDITLERNSTIIIPNDYNVLTVYYDECDKRYNSPFLICIGNQNNQNPDIFYERNHGKDLTKWKQVDTDTSILSTDDGLSQKILKILLSIGLSVKVLLDKLVSYPMEIDPSNSGERVYSKQVTVKLTCHNLGSTLFKCYTQIIPELDNHQSIKELIEYIGGSNIETFSSTTSAGNKSLGNSDLPKEPIYFNLCDKNVYVYFYGDDPRPLLFCYNKRTYRPESKEEYQKKWVNVENLSSTDCTTSGTGPELLIGILKSVCDFLNPIRIDLPVSSTERYWKTKTISLWMETTPTRTSSNCYTKVTHKCNDGYRLGYITHGGNLIKDIKSQKPISAGDFSEVMAFYKDEDTNFKYPLLITLKKENDSTYQPFYELNSNSLKVYKKVDGPITLDEKTLVPTLDLINYNVLKRLSVVLQNQESYNPDLIGTTDRPPPEPPPTNSNEFQLKVTQHHCPSIRGTSFSSYKHELTRYTYLPEVGGLKFQLWEQEDLQLKDITGQPVKVTYTKCKGDLYVYFYQQNVNSNNTDGSGLSNGSSSRRSDTVPLMFLLNGKYYTTNSILNYFHIWSEVNVPTCKYKFIDTELDKTNKMFNRIVLSMKFSYGIPAFTGTKISYPIIRVKVSEIRNKHSSFYFGYIHSTINKSPIGDIYLNDKATTVDIKTIDYDPEGFNQVATFFLLLDNEHLYPLLICFGKDEQYKLYYELECISTNLYKYRKQSKTIDMGSDKEIEKKIVDIIGKLSEDDKDKVLKLFLRDDERYHKELEALRTKLGSNLMKTVIPVGGTYLVAGASVYPIALYIKSFILLI